MVVQWHYFPRVVDLKHVLTRNISIAVALPIGVLFNALLLDCYLFVDLGLLWSRWWWQSNLLACFVRFCKKLGKQCRSNESHFAVGSFLVRKDTMEATLSNVLVRHQGNRHVERILLGILGRLGRYRRCRYQRSAWQGHCRVFSGLRPSFSSGFRIVRQCRRLARRLTRGRVGRRRFTDRSRLLTKSLCYHLEKVCKLVRLDETENRQSLNGVVMKTGRLQEELVPCTKWKQQVCEDSCSFNSTVNDSAIECTYMQRYVQLEWQ